MIDARGLVGLVGLVGFARRSARRTGPSLLWRSLASVSLCLAVLSAVSCGDDQIASGTPGYDGSGPEVDRSEFQMARPESGGPTTIGGPAPTLVRPWETTTTTTIRITTTPTTTTPLPDRIGAPPNADSICRAFFYVASGISAGRKLMVTGQANGSTVDFADIRDPLRRSLQSAADSLTPKSGSDGADDIETILHRRLQSTVGLVRGTTSFDHVGGFMVPLIAAPAAVGENLDWSDIETYLNRVCPSLILELTGTASLNPS